MSNISSREYERRAKVRRERWASLKRDCPLKFQWKPSESYFMPRSCRIRLQNAMHGTPRNSALSVYEVINLAFGIPLNEYGMIDQKEFSKRDWELDVNTLELLKHGGETPEPIPGFKSTRIPPHTFRRIAEWIKRNVRFMEDADLPGVHGPRRNITRIKKKLSDNYEKISSLKRQLSHAEAMSKRWIEQIRKLEEELDEHSPSSPTMA